MNKLLLLLAAAFGGMAPNLLDLGVSLTQGGNLPEWTYAIGLLIFGGLGAAVAAIWKETDLRKAFYLGIGLPAFIQLGVGSVSQQSPTDIARNIDSLLSLNPVAFAQPPSEPLPGRTLLVIPKGDRQNRQVVFSSPEGDRTKTVEITGESAQEVKVPDFASSFEIKQGEVTSEREKLPAEPNAQSKVEVKVEKKSWSGFLRAIGARDTSSQDLVVKPVE